jgi:hypothetical protein
MKIYHTSKYRNENFPKSFTDAVRGGLCWEICPRIRKKVLVFFFFFHPSLCLGFPVIVYTGGARTYRRQLIFLGLRTERLLCGGFHDLSLRLLIDTHI